MPATVNVNGRISDQAHAVISVFDHGFLYGEGIYETLRTYNGVPFLFDRHMQRLRRSADLMTLPVPLSDREIDRRFRETLDAASLAHGADDEAYIRMLVTRGVGELTYDVTTCRECSVVIIVKPHVPPSEKAFTQGVRVSLVDIVRNHPATVNPMIKSNNLLNNALAMQEASRQGAFEGLMRNYKGEIAECTQSNFFVVKNGTALTPPLETGLLPGITRAFMFEIGDGIGVPVREQVLRDADVFEADEAFLTSTTREAVPIVQVNDRVIGAGVPGPITRSLLEAFRKKAQELTRAAAVGRAG